MSEELKPCPFCGGTDIAISVDENQGNKWGSAVGPEVRTGYETYPEASWRAEAAAEWNRRASPVDARREALEEAAKVADEVAADEREEKMADKEAEGEDYDPYSYGAGFLDGSWVTAQNIAKAIRALFPPVKDTTK